MSEPATRTVWVLRAPPESLLNGYTFLTEKHRDDWMAQPFVPGRGYSFEEQVQRRSLTPCPCPDCRERFHWKPVRS